MDEFLTVEKSVNNFKENTITTTKQHQQHNNAYVLFPNGSNTITNSAA